MAVPIGSIEFYDPTLNAWSADTAALALPRFRFSVGQSANKYVFGFLHWHLRLVKSIHCSAVWARLHCVSAIVEHVWFLINVCVFHLS
jgi:hypothetical protein